MGDRWHATVRIDQTNLLDVEAEARGLSRSEAFLVALTLGIDQLRSQRLLGQESETTSKTEPKVKEAPSVTTAKPKKGPARFKKAQSVEPNSRDLVDQLIASTTNIDSVIRPVDGFAVAAPNCPVESPVEVETATASPTSSEPSTSLLDEMVELYGSEAEVIQSGAHPELNTHGQPWTGNIFEDH